MRRAAPLVAACVLLTAPRANGGDLVEGQRVRFKTTAVVADAGAGDPARWIVGTLTGSDEESLTIRLKGRIVRVHLPRKEVTSLQVSRGRPYGKAALSGALIGLAVGLLWGVLEQQQCEAVGGSFCDLALYAPIVTVPAGALLGLVLTPERWTEASPATFRPALTPVRGGVTVGARIGF